MSTVWEVQKDFHVARVKGEEELWNGVITFEEYQQKMLRYEAQLKGMGVNL